MTTFAVLGDSISVGIGDPVLLAAPGGRRWRGWAELLAGSLPGTRAHIVAVNGARASDVLRAQLPVALADRPTLASLIIGVNDILRPDFDGREFARTVDTVLGALHGQGAQVLTMRLPPAGQMLRLPGVLARPLAVRTEEVNAALDAAARKFRTLHFDAAADPLSCDRGMWAADRLHPNERGHRHIARSFHALLAVSGHTVLAPPDADPGNPPPSRIAELTWLATRGTGWVLRRSTDLVPYLLMLAARELLHPEGSDEVPLMEVSEPPHPARAEW